MSEGETRLSGQQVLDGPGILFVDLDGTVRHGKDQLGRFVNGPDDVVVFEQARARLLAWVATGPTIGVTNQAGVALGYMDMPTAEAAIERTIELTRGGLVTALACMHAPDAGCWCRKPLPGMLLRGAMWVEQQLGVEVPRERCVMVGDRDEDEQAARAAGIAFMDAAAWRAGDPYPDGVASPPGGRLL